MKPIRVVATTVALLFSMLCVAGPAELAPNGIELSDNYRDWRLIASSHREDNHTQRVILGNDTAVEAARAGHTNP